MNITAKKEPKAKTPKKVKAKTLKKAVYPSKTTMNLAMREKTDLEPKRLIPGVLAVLLVVALFAKFGVINRLDNLSMREGEPTMQQQIQVMEAATAEYDDISKEYAHYSTKWMSDDMRHVVPCKEVLDLIEKHIMPQGRVMALSTAGPYISVNIGGIDLQIAARFVEDLYTLPVVSDVRVYTAESENPSSQQLKISFVITVMPEALVAQTTEGGAEE